MEKEQQNKISKNSVWIPIFVIANQFQDESNFIICFFIAYYSDLAKELPKNFLHARAQLEYRSSKYSTIFLFVLMV